MEATPKGKELILLGVRLGEPQCRLDGLRSPRIQLDPVEAIGGMGRYLGQGLGPAGCREGPDRHLVYLFLEDLAVTRMGVAEGIHAYARG